MLNLASKKQDLVYFPFCWVSFVVDDVILLLLLLFLFESIVFSRYVIHAALYSSSFHAFHIISNYVFIILRDVLNQQSRFKLRHG